MTAPNAGYVPSDEMTLWWLGCPDTPVLIGRLFYVPAVRGVGLSYSKSWLGQGFALSEDLPLRDQDFLPLEKDSAVGAVDDARPDRWGERVIRVLDRPGRLSLMEYLYFAGDDRFGALGVSLSATSYVPRSRDALARLSDLSAIEACIKKIEDGVVLDEGLSCLVSPGASMGGARPKALIAMEGNEWVLKFRESGEHTDTPLIEHATMRLAQQCGIHVADTMAVPLGRGHAVAVRRFDRSGKQRIHSLSAAVALRAIGEEPGYPALAQLIRRKGSVVSNHARIDMCELFRRMVFNILIDNNDDHEKNHVLLMDELGYLRLSPAFDVLPTGQALSFQQMCVGLQGTKSTLDNALSQHALFGLNRQEALQQIALVCSCVSDWAAYFSNVGVSKADVDLLREQIDRPFLLDQRREWASKT